MTRKLLSLGAAGLLLACAVEPPTQPAADRAPSLAVTGNGFDEYGYNRTARIFNGAADGVDKVLDGAYWGNTDYANDKLLMKWTADWDRGNAEGWSDPAGYPGAWISNEWNGKVKGGSRETWHYKIQWLGPCGADGTPLPDGGYCVWGLFEVILSHGTVANQHFWDAHARSSGFGN